MINSDIPLVHKAGQINEVRLSKISGYSHHKKSLSDISGEFCINFPSLPNVWHENGHISRNSSSNSLVSVRTESQISNITGFEDEINEIKRLTQNSTTDEHDAVSQKINDLNGELKIKNLELDALSEIKRDYQPNLIKIKCQESVIISLKDQIREQYCTIEEHKQRAQIYENTIKILNNEIDVAKKSEFWFKDEFHEAQESKLSLQNRLINLENENLNLKIACNKLKNNIQLVQINSNFIEEKSKREKELLINKLTDYDTEIGNQIEYDTIKLELAELQNKFIKQNTFIDNLTAENDRLTRLLNESKNTVLDLNSKLQQQVSIEETRIKQLFKLAEQNSSLSEANSKLEKDKIEIYDSLKKIKTDFEMIQTHFLNQKHQLVVKDEELNELRAKHEFITKTPECETRSTNTDDVPVNNNLLLIKNESDDVKKLKILMRVVENEHKVKIKRFETNIRLLLKKIKENFRIRKHLESKYEKCNESNNSLVAEKNEIIRILGKIKSLNLNNNIDTVNFIPNLKNNIILFVDEFNKLYDSNSSNLIKLNSQNSAASSLNCKLASLTERQEKMRMEFSQKEQQINYELSFSRNQLNIVTEALRTSEQMCTALTHSKQELLQEIVQLNREIKTLISDKVCLKNLNSEFKENLNLLMDNQQRSAAMRNSTPRIDYKKIKDLLSKSNRSNVNRKPLEPLKTCVDLLKTDMAKLNLIIKNNNSMRYELSLMDELRHAEKFN